MKNKIFKVVILFFTVFCVFSMNSFAGDKETITASGEGMVSKFDGNIRVGATTAIPFIEQGIGTVLSAIRIIATSVAIFMLTFLGIKYMSAAPDEKASIKNQLITFAIGAIIVFGTVSLLDIVKNFAVNATSKGGI